MALFGMFGLVVVLTGAISTALLLEPAQGTSVDAFIISLQAVVMLVVVDIWQKSKDKE